MVYLFGAVAVEVYTCSVVEEENVVANVELVVAKNHATSRIATLHLLHELDLQKWTHTECVTDLD